MATSVGATLLPVRIPPPTYKEAIKCPVTPEEESDHKTSNSLERVTLPREKSSMLSMLLPKNGTDVRLPPALYYHRNSDPLLHRRTQSNLEEFGEVCLLARTRRRSEKDFSRNSCRTDGQKNCILSSSPSGLTQRRGSTPLCNGYIPTFKQNGILKGQCNLNANCDHSMHGPLVNGLPDQSPENCDKVLSDTCDGHCDDVRDSVVLDCSKPELDDLSLENEEHGKLRCEESLTIDIPELFSSAMIGETENGCDTPEAGEKLLKLPDPDETEVKNVDLSPRVLCNGTLITSHSEHDIESSETHPFILRDDSISGSESNCSVKRSSSWQKARPLSSLSIGSGENIGSLPGSLERHLTVTRNNSGSGSESNCSVKPVFSKKNPVSNFSSRSCSPQPGPSGYDVKSKKTGKKTVTYSDTVGDNKVELQEDNSHNITYQNSMAIENMHLLDEEIKAIEREGSKANRGTIYCACGIFAAVIGAILIFVLMIKSSIPG